YRLAATANGTGWSAALRNEFAAVKFGQSVQVPVYVTKGTGQGAVTLRATAESDPSKSVEATCASGDLGGSVPATLSLTLGGTATFGAFTPGVAKDYTASTTPNVVSTAGNGTLSGA